MLRIYSIPQTNSKFSIDILILYNCYIQKQSQHEETKERTFTNNCFMMHVRILMLKSGISVGLYRLHELYVITYPKK